MIHRLVILSREARAAWLQAHSAYDRLIAAHHSQAKATRILRECERGDRYALQWLLAVGGQFND